MPSSVMGMAGLRWTKKYIWRLNGAASTDQKQQEQQDDNNPEMGGISVWFVKIKSSKEKAETGDEDEPDYLFHEFDFNYRQKQQDSTEPADATKPHFEPPTPPPLILPDLREKYPETSVIQATGDHLCVKDMYYTAYSFRVVPETGDVQHLCDTCGRERNGTADGLGPWSVPRESSQRAPQHTAKARPE